MSGRRELAIIRAVKQDGGWSGRISGWKVGVEKFPCESRGHAIHWYFRSREYTFSGWARTVREAFQVFEIKRRINAGL